MVRGAAFGWLEDLEETRSEKKKVRDTPSYWKKLLKEAGWDDWDIQARDHKVRKRKVMERQDYIDRWEQSQRKQFREDEETIRDMQRSEWNPVNSTSEHTCPVCGKMCKSKAGDQDYPDQEGA